jgi:hypothetical protein
MRCTVIETNPVPEHVLEKLLYPGIPQRFENLIGRPMLDNDAAVRKVDSVR